MGHYFPSSPPQYSHPNSTSSKHCLCNTIQYSFLQFPTPSWKVAMKRDQRWPCNDRGIWIIFLPKVLKKVSIIARSPLVLLRCKGTATFQDGAGNCKTEYWNGVGWTYTAQSESQADYILLIKESDHS